MSLKSDQLELGFSIFALTVGSKQMSLCCVKLVKLLPVHQYSVDIFSYIGPSGILSSDGKQNTA